MARWAHCRPAARRGPVSRSAATATAPSERRRIRSRRRLAEHLGFWQHLRAAGFLTGSAADVGVAALPKNAFGGLTGIAALTTQLNNMNATVACMSQVPGKAATALDNQLDDGLPNTGTVRATLQAGANNTAPGAAAAAYSEDQRYTVCSPL